jgi:hypothetical protein
VGLLVLGLMTLAAVIASCGLVSGPERGTPAGVEVVYPPQLPTREHRLAEIRERARAAPAPGESSVSAAPVCAGFDGFVRADTVLVVTVAIDRDPMALRASLRGLVDAITTLADGLSGQLQSTALEIVRAVVTRSAVLDQASGLADLRAALGDLQREQAIPATRLLGELSSQCPGSGAAISDLVLAGQLAIG